jgi:hypothetical protein
VGIGGWPSRQAKEEEEGMGRRGGKRGGIMGMGDEGRMGGKGERKLREL